MSRKSYLNTNDPLEYLLRILKFLKPEFYNKVTWAIVVAGLALISTTFLDKLISALFEVSFQIKITDGYDANIGLLLVVIGLIYHIIIRIVETGIVYKKDKDIVSKKIDHDISIFSDSDIIMPETTLKNILDWIGTDHSYKSDQMDKIRDYYYSSIESGRSYLNLEIDDAKDILLKNLGELIVFLSYNFFVFPNNQREITRFCLYPELNIDRSDGLPNEQQQAKYDEKEKEMYELIDNIYVSYISFRSCVKKILYR